MSYYAVLMSGRHPLLLPAGSVPTTSPDAASSSKAMPRRNLTQNACVGCRKKRTKCDGGSPCAGCIVRKEKCDYEDKTYVTKDNLRAEVKSLRLETINNRAVLCALLGDHHRAIAQRLRAGETVDAVAQTLTDLDIKGKGKIKQNEEEEDGQGAGQDHAVVSTSPDQNESMSPTTTSNIPGFDFSLPIPILNTGMQISAAPGLIYLQGLPEITPEKSVLPLAFLNDGTIGLMDSFSSASGSIRPAHSTSPLLPDGASVRHGSDSSSSLAGFSGSSHSSWTNVAANSIAVNYLIGLFFSWEFPPFTMVSQELFMRDYFQNKSDFCSSALVNAIASLATRYLEETEEVGEAYTLGERFFRESRKLLVLEARTPNLPSIQAFGLLALRELSCGRECEAQTLCLQALHCVARLADEDMGVQNKPKDFIAAYSSAVSGVLTLARVTGLITPKLSPASVSNPDGPRDRMLPVQLEERVSQILSLLSPRSDPTTADLLSNFIFEQTDCVYAFLSRAGDFGTRRVTDQLHMVYQKCLSSYQSITDLLHGEDGKSSPYTLFVHIYFQFSLLVLFHPFVDQYLDMAGDWPRTICTEATQAILSLAQSYDGLYTLRRMPCFAPYCVFAAGLTQILLNIDEGKGSEGGYPSANQTTGWSPGSTTSPGSVPGASPATSATTDADSRYHSVGSSRSRSGGDVGDTDMTGTDASRSTSRSATTNITTPGSEQAEPRVTLAVYLLSQMSLGHPAASQAAWVLRHLTPDQLGPHHGSR